MVLLYFIFLYIITYNSWYITHGGVAGAWKVKRLNRNPGCRSGTGGLLRLEVVG